ncbi:MAG: hypothetical protein LBV67_09625 [Streptococcaceae bacterium]|jgi:hypothetical protein|nr:hypothetical protein [Streptococcaceae bacterium]
MRTDERIDNLIAKLENGGGDLRQTLVEVLEIVKKLDQDQDIIKRQM